MSNGEIIHWEKSDGAMLRRFLEVCPKFLPMLRQSFPSLKANTLQEKAMNASKLEGAQDLYNTILVSSARESVEPGNQMLDLDPPSKEPSDQL